MQALPPSPRVTALPAPAPADDGTRPRPAPPQGASGTDAQQAGRNEAGQDSSPPGAPETGGSEVADGLDAADVVDVADAAAALIPVQRRDRGRLPATALVRFPPVRTRPRGTPVQDSVVFTAACPACGQDCEWAERRDDTRLSAAVHCSCDGVA